MKNMRRRSLRHPSAALFCAALPDCKAFNTDSRRGRISASHGNSISSPPFNHL